MNYYIHKALDLMLETEIAGSVPIAWENTPFTPPQTGAYLQADYLPAQTEDISVQGEAAIYRGIYQVTVITPKGTGAQGAERLARAITAIFKNNRDVPLGSGMPSAFVNGHPSVFDGIPDGDGYRIPVSIPYLLCA